MRILQNVKLGFANIKELLGIIVGDDTNNEGYDLYIKSEDPEIANTAKNLKEAEEIQEANRFSILDVINTSRGNIKKNFKVNASSENELVPKPNSNNVHLLEGNEPEKE